MSAQEAAYDAGFVAGLDEVPRQTPAGYLAHVIYWLAGYDEGIGRVMVSRTKLAKFGIAA